MQGDKWGDKVALRVVDNANQPSSHWEVRTSSYSFQLSGKETPILHDFDDSNPQVCGLGESEYP